MGYNPGGKKNVAHVAPIRTLLRGGHPSFCLCQTHLDEALGSLVLTSPVAFVSL